MDKLPKEIIIKIVNKLDELSDQINLIGIVTCNDQLLKKYYDRQLTPQEIKSIEYFITLNLPYSYKYLNTYIGIFKNACYYNIKDSKLLYFKPNNTNMHSTSSNVNRRYVHNYFKTMLKKILPFETNESFILMIKILDYTTSKKVNQICIQIEWLLPFKINESFNLMIKILDYVTSTEVDQVCIHMEWLLYVFYIDFLNSLDKDIFSKESVIKNLTRFFMLFNNETQNSSCETCKQLLTKNN